MCRRLTGVLVAVILVIGCYEDDSSNLDAWQNAADVLETVGEVGETRLGPGFDQVSSTADVMEVPTLLGEELEDSVFRNEWGIDLAERATEIVTGDVTPLAAISTL